MSEVTLRDVTRENWIECARLEVAEAQSAFVAPNAWSLAESKYDPVWIPQAVYAGDEMVGFVMYGVEDGAGWILRLMVDERHQGKGYGLAAVRAAVPRLKALVDGPFRLSVMPSNTAALEFYRKAGFRETGEMSYGEVVMDLVEDAG